MARGSLWNSLETGLEVDGFYNLSSWGDDSLTTMAEIAEAADLPHGQLRATRLGELRALGYDPYASEPWPHVTVQFEAKPTDTELDELENAFGDPIPNPYNRE